MIAIGVGALMILRPSILTDLLSQSSIPKTTTTVAAACTGHPQPLSGLYASTIHPSAWLP